MALVVIVATVVVIRTGADGSAPVARAGGVWIPGVSRTAIERPEDARDRRLLDAPEVREQGTFAFLRTGPDGHPVAYDPCVPIHVSINPRTGGPAAVTVVEEAIDEVQAATGLEFVVDGITDHEPRFEARSAEGGRRTLLIAWTEQDQVPGLRGRVAGLGGSAVVEQGREQWYVTGQIALDGPQLAEMDEDEQIAVVMHELGHVVGLDHVDDAGEVMSPTGTERRAWGPGDRYALSVVGSAPCN